MNNDENTYKQALAELVHKIDTELKRGQPLHPKGHEDCL
jgi:hypothetical protein